jgi:two-component system C4-dicarboxylate transport sensor histidine kinase DctB
VIAWCDQNRLQQVLINLIGNAADAMADQSRPKQLTISAAYGDEGGVVVRVADSGPGLSEDALAHLFEPFFTTKPMGEGLGIGLAISQDIVRDFGGALSAANGPHGGAVFTLDLPSVKAREHQQG